jgi:hypothetical protein
MACSIRNEGKEERLSSGNSGIDIGRNPDGTFALGHEGIGGRPKGSVNYKNKILDAFRTFYLEDLDWLKSFHENFKASTLNPNSDAAKFMAERLYSKEVLEELDEFLTRGAKRELAFLRYMIYIDLFDEQREALLTQKPWIISIGGRRAGKTKNWSSLLVDRSIVHDKGVALYLGRTAKSAFEMIWRPTVECLKMIGVEFEQHIGTQNLLLGNGVEIQVRGRNTKEDIENLRGKPYFLAIVDEIQSDATEKLKYIVKDILEPAGKDFTDSQIALGGTPPRVPGNYAEAMYMSMRQDIKRLSWDMSVNPHIPESERDLEKTRIQRGFTENDPTWQREYLGRVGTYDVDALVLRLKDNNAFTDEELAAWIASQSVADIRFTAGMDFGFEDADALAIIAYSITKPERFLVYEWKARRQSTEEIAAATRAGIEYISKSPMFERVENKSLQIYADTGGNKITPNDLAVTYKLPIQPAYKAEKEMGFELLQGEARVGSFKARREGPLWEECLRTVYARDEQDRLTRTIDDETYHPDMIPAVTYGMRPVWMFGRQRGEE